MAFIPKAAKKNTARQRCVEDTGRMAIKFLEIIGEEGIGGRLDERLNGQCHPQLVTLNTGHFSVGTSR